MLPNTYWQLEYIESTGTQYINTGVVVGGNDIKIDATFKYTSFTSSGQVLFGASVSNRWFFFNADGSTRWKVQIGGGDTEKYINGVDTNWHTLNLDSSTGTFKFDDTELSLTSSNVNIGNNIYAFARNSAGSVSQQARCCISDLTIYKAGSIVRDYIPAMRKEDSAVGMYDDVNGIFYTNAGSGTFIAGGLVDAPLNIIYTDNPLSFKLGSDVELVANFELMYNITINYDVTLGSATYQWIEGTQVEFTATPYANAQFLGWYLEDELVSTNRTIELTIEDDFTIEARFEDIYEITTNCVGNGNITYTRGSADKNLVTFTATPYLISRFIRFIYNYTVIVDKGALTSDEDKIITQDNNYLMVSTQEGRSTEYEESSFTVRLYSDVTLIAYFEDVFECIYDRVQPDVDRVKELNEKLQKDNYTQDELAEWRTEMKGALNLSDLTRVRNNTKYLALRLGVSITAQDNIPEIPTEEFYSIMLNNVKAVKEAWMVYADTPALPANPLNYYPKWNIIEKTLWDIYSILEASMWYHAGIDLMAEDNILI